MIGRVCWRFSDVESTQDIAFLLAEQGAAHGTVVRADHQSAGRGRQGRTWESVRGTALMFSIILRPELQPHELGAISILTADALADAIGKITSDPIQIKWPNDVLVNGGKVSGILLQNRVGTKPVVVMGIGVNVSSVPDAPGATCLKAHAAEPIDNEVLFAGLLSHLDRTWTTFRPEIDDATNARLESRLWQHGSMVSIIDGEREVQGRILGLARNGGLRMSVDGTERVVVAGEIVRGPRPIAGRK